jgi:hypothetical protein
MAKVEDPLQYFVAGQQYSRQDIHDRYGAQRKGPVATPHDHWPYLFLFVRLRKEANAQWTDNVLYYTGAFPARCASWFFPCQTSHSRECCVCGHVCVRVRRVLRRG